MASEEIRGNDTRPRDTDDEADAGEPPRSGLLAIDASLGEVSCFASSDEVEVDPPSGDRHVELGAADRQTETLFVPFDASCGLPIDGIGQAGLLARAAVRVAGNVPRASVELRIYNALDDERRPGINADASDLRELSCPGDGYCYAVPVYVEISHLNRLPELEGTLLRLSATVTPEGEPPSTLGAWGVFERW